MPSHKHKKKKKSHKQSKKYVSSSSDSESGLWNVKCSNSDSDDTKNHERLTSLVRGSYTNHLQQALAQNIEGWTNNSNEFARDTMQELVNKWCSGLEQKALRSCMISELYRKNMVSLIKQIKACTNEGTLYIEERMLSKLKLKLPSNKITQTENINMNHLKSVETQTDPPFSSLLDLPLPKTLPFSPSTRPYDPAIDFSDSNSNGAGVSSSLGFNQQEPPSIITANQDICNISSTSDFIASNQFLSDIVQKTDIKNALNNLNLVPDIKDVQDKSIIHTYTEDCPAEIILPPNKNSVTSCNQIGDRTVSVGVDKEESIHKKRQSSLEVFCNTTSKKDNLDARLTAMGLLGEVDTEAEMNAPSLPLSKCKKSNWYAEEVAQSCNLTRILLRMSTNQRERVSIKIKELFGDEDETLTELTEANISICRKRIASIVVLELTPIYQAKRIASRHLFKFLAKKITKSLMEKSYAPDSRSIRWKVKEFFNDGKIVMSESDCN